MKRKNTHLTDKQIEQYKKVLLATQTKILTNIGHMESDNLNSHKDAAGDLSGYSLHMADVGTDNYDRELALDFVGNEQAILYEIEKSLERINAGTYGVCEMYGTPIPKKRLDAIPWTPFCKEAAEKIEKERGRG
ncbi:MAG: Transcriptional regulator, TraR/DksA family [uncultured bacterium]|nr:MAG: Transcriptional regulator, TraR/DksA family [uncultured bacterium]